MIRLLFLVPLAACFTYSSRPSEGAAPKLRNIAEATILDMTVDLYKQKGLCPGAEGKLYATARVQWPGAKEVNRNIGSDVDSLAPASFEITGPLIKGDAEAHLHPNADVLASVESGFRTHVVYTPQRKYTFDVEFPPEYSCFKGYWNNGGEGRGGQDGGYGGDGDWGQSGGQGGNGTPGEAGGAGGRVVAYVTFASTKFYPRLLAVIANDTFFLAPPDVPLVFGATGGPGGGGGAGGNGGRGGDQATESREVWDPDTKSNTNVAFGVGAAGNGGNGGNGARGGRGGDGGSVEVVIDSRFPELANLVQTDVRGGAGGAAGGYGAGGEGGGTNAERNASTGNPGNNGYDGGENGADGRQGSARVTRGDVARRFANLRGVTILGGRR
jgi:hypothetical protein